MPLCEISWDKFQKRGNPTKSAMVNNLIKNVKKFEVRQQGALSNVVRPVEFDEFINILSIIRMEKGIEKYRLCSLLTLQWAMIGRIDDIMKLKFINLSSNINFKFSKNLLVKKHFGRA